MVDFSVEGFANLKESVSDAAKDMAEGLFKTAGAAEAAGEESEEAGDAMGDLAEATAAAGGVMEKVQEEMQETEEELEDITQDAGAATTSLGTLAGTLQAIDGTEAEVDVDAEGLSHFMQSPVSNIDVGKFLPDEGTQQGFLQSLERAAGGLSEQVGGQAFRGLQQTLEQDNAELSDLVRNLHNATDASVELGDIMTALRDTTEAQVENVDMLDQQYDEMRNSVTRTNEALEDLTIPRRAAGQPISDFIGDQREAEETIQRLRDAQTEMENAMDVPSGPPAASDVVSTDPFSGGGVSDFVDPERIDDFREGMKEVEEEMNEVEETSGGIESGLQKAVGHAAELGERIEESNESVNETTEDVDKLSEAFADTPLDQPLNNIFGDDGVLEDLRSKFAEMDLDMDDPLFKMDAEEVWQMEGFKEALRENVEGIDPNALGRLSPSRSGISSVGDIAKRASEDKGIDTDIQSAASGVVAGFEAVQESADETEEDVDDVENKTNAASRAFAQAAAISPVLSGTLRGVANSFEEAGEEADDTTEEVIGFTGAVNTLMPALSSVSANIGPFNVGLKNMLVTIPALLAVMTPLVATVGALAVAVGTVVAAFGAFAAVGAIAVAESLKNQFAGIKSTGEAFKAMLKGLKEALKTALEPLFKAQLGKKEGSLGAVQFFIRIIQDLVAFVHMLATAFKEILAMEKVENFFYAMEAALLGTNKAGEGTKTVLGEIKDVLRVILPFIQAFAVWFIEHLPEALNFFEQQAKAMLPALAAFGKGLVTMAVGLAQVGSGIMTKVLPALGALFVFIGKVVGALAKLFALLGPVGDGLLFLTGSLLVTTAAMTRLAGVLDTFGIKLAEVVANSSMLASSLAKVTAGIALMLAGVLLAVDGLVQFINAFRNGIDPIQAFLGALKVIIGAYMTLVGWQLLTGATLKSALIPSLNTATISNYNFAASIQSVNLSLATLGSILTALAGALLAFGAAVALGIIELEQIPIIGGAVQNVLEALAQAFGLTAETIEAVIGVLTALAGAFIILSAVGVTSISAITAALIASGLGALLVAAGVAILAVAKAFGKLEAVALAVIGAITAALVSSGWGAILILIGATLMFVAKRFGVLKAIALAVIGAITAALIGSGWGAMLIVIGGALLFVADHFNILAEIAKAAIAAITLALLTSGWGSVLVGIGVAITTLMGKWEALRNIIVQGSEIIVSAIDFILGPLDEWINKLLKIIGLLKTAASLAPVPGMGEKSEGGGLGSVFAKTAGGAAAGAAAGSVIPGAGTVGGAIVGGLAGLADATILGKGGYVTEGGLAFLHSNELVIPKDKLQQTGAQADVGISPQQAQSRRARPATTGQTQINVNVDNSGRGDIGPREARMIAETVESHNRRERRREDGR